MSSPSPAQIYEDFFVASVFGPWADLVVDIARPASGERVLDLACGTGAVARRVLPLVGDGGSVTGLDLRPGMLAVAAGLESSVDWVEGDATALGFPDDSFDLVICQQGFQFFPDRARAASEIHRVLNRGGRAVINVWADLSEQQLFKSLTEVEAKHLGPLGVSYEDVAGPFLFGDPDDLAALFAEAGFAEVEVDTHTLGLAIPDADHFVENVELAYSAVVPALAEDPAAFAAYVRSVTLDLQPELDRYRMGDEIRFELKSNIARLRP